MKERVETNGKIYEHVRWNSLIGGSPCSQCDVDLEHCESLTSRICEMDYVLKEIKEEPETKRDNPRGAEKAWVLHKFDLLDQTEYVSIRQRDKGHNGLSEQDVKVYSDNRVNETILAEGAACEFRMIKINPPTSEPETVEQVIKRMPNPDNYKTMTGINGFVENFRDWQKDLKEAQEMERNGKS